MKYILSLIFAMIMMASCSKTDTASADIQNLVQTQALPKVWVRLANPVETATTIKYDFQFKSEIQDARMEGMNIRFFIPANQFNFGGLGDFVNGYGPTPPNPPQVSTASASSGPALFNVPGAVRYINGSMNLINPSAPPVYLNDWTSLFSITLNKIGVVTCPIVILDKEHEPNQYGGFLPSDGITITLRKANYNNNNSFYTDEYVEHINWVQTQNKMPYGNPVPCGN